MIEKRMVRLGFLEFDTEERHECHTPGTRVMLVCQTLEDLCAELADSLA